tara:strand:- start:872 stop:1105 length:234 start_codon:yes stop_codon:yes gene_type:complete
VKKLYLIFALVFATSAIADEKKTITPQEFATTLSEVPNKVGNFLTNEVEKTKAYQTKVWSETMKTWPWNKIFKKGNE